MFVRESIAVKIIILDNHGYLTENLKTTGSFNRGFDIDWCLYAKSIGFGYAATVKTTDSLNNVFQHFTETNASQSLLSIDIPPRSIPQQLNNLMTWDIVRRASS
jgi:TPP-dependent 2-oxoacid decarboxylase